MFPLMRAGHEQLSGGVWKDVCLRGEWVGGGGWWVAGTPGEMGRSDG